MQRNSLSKYDGLHKAFLRYIKLMRLNKIKYDFFYSSKYNKFVFFDNFNVFFK